MNKLILPKSYVEVSDSELEYYDGARSLEDWDKRDLLGAALAVVGTALCIAGAFCCPVLCAVGALLIGVGYFVDKLRPTNPSF